MYGIISEELIIRNFQKAQLSVIGRHNVTTHTLRLFTDLYAPGENASPLPPVARVLYVVAGGITVRASSVTASLDPNSAWQGSVTPQVVAGKSGARVLRWELVRSNLAEDTHARAEGATMRRQEQWVNQHARHTNHTPTTSRCGSGACKRSSPNNALRDMMRR